MNKEQNVQWQYRTLLFEFQKDGLLGDKYIDDEEAESILNEQGASGWELVNVTMIQEGLLAFCKRQVTGVNQQKEVRQSFTPNITESVNATTLQQQEREHIQDLENQRREAMSTIEKDLIGEIKIS